LPTKKSTAPIQREWPALIRVIFQMEKTNRKRNQEERERPVSAIYREEEGDLEREIIWRERERREKVVGKREEIWFILEFVWN